MLALSCQFNIFSYNEQRFTRSFRAETCIIMYTDALIVIETEIQVREVVCDPLKCTNPHITKGSRKLRGRAGLVSRAGRKPLMLAYLNILGRIGHLSTSAAFAILFAVGRIA